MGNTCRQFTVVVSAERQKKIRNFSTTGKKKINLSEEHAAEQNPDLTCPSRGRKGCMAQSISQLPRRDWDC